MSITLLPFPLSLRPPLPTIVGNVDYRKTRQELLRIDALLIQSGIEQRFIAHSLERDPRREHGMMLDDSIECPADGR